MLADVSPTRATLAASGPTLAESGPNSVQAKAAQFWQSRPSLARNPQNLDRNRQSSVRCRPNLDQNGLISGRSQPSWVALGPLSAENAPDSANVGPRCSLGAEGWPEFGQGVPLEQKVARTMHSVRDCKGCDWVARSSNKDRQTQLHSRIQHELALERVRCFLGHLCVKARSKIKIEGKQAWTLDRVACLGKWLQTCNLKLKAKGKRLRKAQVRGFKLKVGTLTTSGLESKMGPNSAKQGPN